MNILARTKLASTAQSGRPVVVGGILKTNLSHDGRKSDDLFFKVLEPTDECVIHATPWVQKTREGGTLGVCTLTPPPQLLPVYG